VNFVHRELFQLEVQRHLAQIKLANQMNLHSRSAMQALEKKIVPLVQRLEWREHLQEDLQHHAPPQILAVN
jgi:hypothetical protein